MMGRFKIIPRVMGQVCGICLDICESELDVGEIIEYSGTHHSNLY